MKTHKSLINNPVPLASRVELELSHFPVNNHLWVNILVPTVPQFNASNFLEDTEG